MCYELSLAILNYHENVDATNIIAVFINKATALKWFDVICDFVLEDKEPTIKIIPDWMNNVMNFKRDYADYTFSVRLTCRDLIEE